MNKIINEKIAFVLSLTLIVVFSSCTGKKKENDEAAGHEMKNATMQDTSTADIKVFDVVDPSVKIQFKKFLVDYFALNQALFEDSMDGAKVAAKNLAETVGKFDMSKLAGEQMIFYHAQEAKLNQGLKGISESADIEEIREELSPVSQSIYSLTKAFRPNDSELYYQFCPMAKNGDGANWLSATKEIENPYMGQRMSKCGRTQEVIAQLK
jgi:hypothetical protein